MAFTTLSGRPVVPSAAGRACAEALGFTRERWFPVDAEGRALPVPKPRRSRDAISEALELDVSELQWERLVEDVNAFVGARDAGQLDARSLLADRFRTTLSLHHNTDMSEADVIQRGTKMLKSVQEMRELSIRFEQSRIREQQPGAIAFRNEVRNQLAQAAARRQGLPAERFSIGSSPPPPPRPRSHSSSSMALPPPRPHGGSTSSMAPPPLAPLPPQPSAVSIQTAIPSTAQAEADTSAMIVPATSADSSSMEVDAGDPPPPFDAVTAIDALLAGRSQEETFALRAELTLRQGARPKYIERCLEVFTDHARNKDANDDGGEAAEPLARPYPGTRCTLAPAAIDAIKQFEGKYVTLLLTKDDAKVGAYLAAEAMRREVSLNELRAQLVPNLTTAAGVLKQCVCGANDGRKPSQGIALAFAAHDTCGLVPASGIAVHDLTIEYMQQLMTSPPADMLQALSDLLQSECWLVRFKPEDVALAVLRCEKLSAATSPLQVCRLEPTGTVTFARVAITSRGDGGAMSFAMMQDDETMKCRFCFAQLVFTVKITRKLYLLVVAR